MKVCPACRARFHGKPVLCPLDGTPLAEMQDPLIGRVLDGRYRLVERLGEGAMGAVYRARHEVLPREVAVKLLSPELALEPLYRERFLREARSANRIQHPNVIDITDVGETEDGIAYFVMELLLGRTLATQIAHGPMAPARALRIVAQAASALERAHAIEVVHRDLKPENIFLIERDGDPDFVKIIDFGLARAMNDPRLTGSGVVFGTPEYMAPEQARGAPVGPPADLYALGVILFEMLTSRLPFEGQTAELLVKHIQAPAPSPRRLVPTIPVEVERIALRLLQKKPEERYRDAEELANAVYAIIGEPPDRASARLLVTQPTGGGGGQAAQETRPTAAIGSDVWRERLAAWRSMMERPGFGKPPWMDDVAGELARTVGHMTAIEEELHAHAEATASQSASMDELRGGLTRAMDELSLDEGRSSRELDEIVARVRRLEVRCAAARAELDPARDAVAQLIEGDMTPELALALELAGRRASAWRVVYDELDATQRRAETRGRDVEDLRFQLSQIRGRLASLGVEHDSDARTSNERLQTLATDLDAAVARAAALGDRLGTSLGEAPSAWNGPTVPSGASPLPPSGAARRARE